jgi:hypothetical protein
VWVRQNFSSYAKLATATRHRRQTAVSLGTPRYADGIRVDDVAASPLRAGYAGAEEYFDVRDSYDGAYFYGTFRSRGTDHQSFGRCIELDRACFGYGGYMPPHVETSGNAIAWGPFHDGGPDHDSQNILVKDYATDAKPPGAILKARNVLDFRMAGRFLAYTDDEREIVLIDWRANQEVRRIPVPDLETFDLDRAGRVFVARGTSTSTRFGLYNTRGDLLMLRARSPQANDAVWIANGRLAFRRVTGLYEHERSTWYVTTLRGRTLASMRAPSGAKLTDFDGSCLAWSRSQRSIYVAAVGHPPRTSVCRR